MGEQDCIEDSLTRDVPDNDPIMPTSPSNSATPVFAPLHLKSVWTEPGTTTKMVTVAIVIPSGAQGFSVRVLEGGRMLEFSVKWPEPLFNLTVMHRKWLRSGSSDRMEEYHPKFLGFEASLKQFRNRADAEIESQSRIALPFPVQTHIAHKSNLAWTDNSTRMVYVDLKAYEDEYSLQQNENSFEIY